MKRKNGKFLPDFFTRFHRCIGIKIEYWSRFGETDGKPEQMETEALLILKTDR